jgi:hypothetical protein
VVEAGLRASSRAVCVLVLGAKPVFAVVNVGLAEAESLALVNLTRQPRAFVLAFVDGFNPKFGHTWASNQSWFTIDVNGIPLPPGCYVRRSHILVL